MKNYLILPMAVVAAGALAAAGEPSLTSVGVLNELVPESGIRGMSQDGAYVVGRSLDRSGAYAPFLWTRGGGLQPLPNPEGQVAVATGVEFCMPRDELIIAGNSDPGIGAWRYSSLSGAWTQLPPAGNCRTNVSNSVGLRTDGTGAYFAGIMQVRGWRARYKNGVDDYADVSGDGTSTGLTGVSPAGRCVGWDKGGTGGNDRPIYWDGTTVMGIPTWYPPLYKGMAYQISQDGLWVSGYMYASTNEYHGFLWSVNATFSTELYPLPGDSLANGVDVANGGGIVGGWSWNPFPPTTGTNRATFWREEGGLYSAYCLMDYLTGLGVYTGEWTTLTRVYSVSDDGTVLAGDGIWAADGSTRGFVAVIAGLANNPPVAHAGPDQEVKVSTTVQLSGSGWDPDGDPIVGWDWRLLSVPPGSVAWLSDPSVNNPTFIPDQLGDYLLSLRVFDGQEWSLPDEVTVTAIPANSPPVADAGQDQQVAAGATVQLDGSGSDDPDGDPILEWQWVIESKPLGSTAILNNTYPGVVNPTFVADVGGAYVISLVVYDGQTWSLPDTVTITAKVPGDVDGDGHVDVVDLLYLVDAFGSVVGDPNYNPACDFNSDGWVDVVDLLTLVENFGT